MQYKYTTDMHISYSNDQEIGCPIFILCSNNSITTNGMICYCYNIMIIMFPLLSFYKICYQYSNSEQSI